MRINTRLFTLLTLLVFTAQSFITEKLFYTTVRITNPLIENLVKSQAFQRLKDVRQYGIRPLLLPRYEHTKEYTRYNHSIGVWWLTQRYGASQEEQAAALLHDASHTAFSHVGDQIFDHIDGKSSYQDDHHTEFLSETDIPEVLQIFNITLEDINHKNPFFTCLEQDLPDICADRLEYNLAGGVLEKLITKEDVSAILDHLKFENNRWYFTDMQHAAQFARISLWHTEHIWGAPLDSYASTELAQAIKIALKLNIITLQEIKHGTDDIVLQKLQACNNAQINQHMQNIREISSQEDKLTKTKRTNKFRGINPWVQVGDNFMRLTEMDAEFKAEYERVKNNAN